MYYVIYNNQVIELDKNGRFCAHMAKYSYQFFTINVDAFDTRDKANAALA